MDCPVCYRPKMDHDAEEAKACQARMDAGERDELPPLPPAPGSSTAIGEAYRQAGFAGIREARQRLAEAQPASRRRR